MSITIRPLVSEDKDNWRTLWTGYLAYYESQLEDEIYEVTFNRLIDPTRTQQNGLIALKDGKAVGFVHYIYHAHNWRVEEVCYLQDLYTDTSVRGEGVGRKLIEAVYDAADANNTPSVYWLTQDFNKTARKLYDRVADLTPFIKYQRKGV